MPKTQEQQPARGPSSEASSDEREAFRNWAVQKQRAMDLVLNTLIELPAGSTDVLSTKYLRAWYRPALSVAGFPVGATVSQRVLLLRFVREANWARDGFPKWKIRF